MKKKTFLLFFAGLFGLTQAIAGNVLTVNDVTLPQGGQATLEIGCEFDTEYTAFELQLALPDGLTDVTEIEANHPYIIKVSSAISEFTVDGVDIDPKEEPVVQVGRKSSERGWMYGTYIVTKVPEENLFLSENKFWYSTGNTTTKAFRGYFMFHDVQDAYYDETSAPVYISIGGETTRLDQLNIDGEDSNYYD